jgi:hypothetical protein
MCVRPRTHQAAGGGESKVGQPHFHPARQSGAKATAVQTLRAVGSRQAVAKRLDCGRFTAAFSTNATKFAASHLICRYQVDKAQINFPVSIL